MKGDVDLRLQSYFKNNIYANRGMTLEDDINKTNEYYDLQNIAIIYKKPTPIKVVNVEYNNRINTKIKEAYYQIPSTTDYNGIYKGNLTYLLFGEDIVCFEEKYSRKSIPLDYFKEHGFLVELKYTPRLDYIKIIEKIIKEVK